uniref:Uncharacterized protein n=1 Tax=Glossina pallidipes TaxID=7398 RepID=A0A1A9ZDK2_GLOPL
MESANERSFPAPCVSETGILSSLSSHLNEKADKTQLLPFTSRCSVICPSLSLKNSVGLTSDTQRNRRASCTAINELFLTPRINTRRLSISLDNEKTANLQMSRADTAQEFFNVEHLNIPLEMNEDMGTVVGENENVQTDHNAEKEKSRIIKEYSALIVETICTSEEVIYDTLDETVENFTRDAKANINRVNVKDMGEQQLAADMSQSSAFNAEAGSLIYLNNKSEEAHKGEVQAENIHENVLESVPSNMNNVRVIANLLKTRTPTNSNNNEELACTSRGFLDSLNEVKQLLKTPASCRTVHSSDIHEQINIPKRCSIPPLSDLKEPLDTFEKNVKSVAIDNVETYQNFVMDKNFDKYVVTPRAKNLMIAGSPSSSVVEKTGNSVELPRAEYDFTISKSDNVLLDDLFKTVASSSCLIRSYFEEDGEQVEKRESSKHVQEIKIYIPISSVTEWKSLIAQTPTQNLLSSASEILWGLSRSSVKELVEPAKKAETLSKMRKHGYQVDPNEDLSTKDTTPGVTCSYTSLYLPFTKSVMNVTNISDVMFDTSSTSQRNLTDPLVGTSIVEFANKHELSSASLDSKGDIRGIHLLDKTTESMSNDQAMDSQKDEQVSTFSLQIIDDDKVNQLSEPLIVTDSEDFNNLRNDTPGVASTILELSVELTVIIEAVESSVVDESFWLSLLKGVKCETGTPVMSLLANLSLLDFCIKYFLDAAAFKCESVSLGVAVKSTKCILVFGYWQPLKSIACSSLIDSVVLSSKWIPRISPLESSEAEESSCLLANSTILVQANTEKNLNNSSNELSRTFLIDSKKNADKMTNMKLNKDDPQARNCFEKIKNLKVIISERTNRKVDKSQKEH